MDCEQDIMKEACKPDVEGVLATIFRIDGSAYRKSGAMMFFSKCGLEMGMISGGCLEEDLAKRAKSLMEDTIIRSQIISYDMTAEDDLGWGRGAGCNGVVHILLEKVDEQLKAKLRKLSIHLYLGSTVYLMKKINLEVENNQENLESDVKQVSVETTIVINRYAISEIISNEGNHLVRKGQIIFVQTITPKPRLIIFGAGMDVRPLATMANEVGFSVIVWDWRQQLLSQDLFPKANLINTYCITEADDKITINMEDYVVIMTHDFQKDKEILQYILQNKPTRYLGILGPRRRTSRLLNGAIPKHIHSPIGLSIDADGPKEIAISIVAELIAEKRRKRIGEERTFDQTEYNRDIFSSGK